MEGAEGAAAAVAAGRVEAQAKGWSVPLHFARSEVDSQWTIIKPNFGSAADGLKLVASACGGRAALTPLMTLLLDLLCGRV